jgi:hypothetical protein
MSHRFLSFDYRNERACFILHDQILREQATGAFENVSVRFPQLSYIVFIVLC